MASVDFTFLEKLFEQVWGYKTQAFKPEFSIKPGRNNVAALGASYYNKDQYGVEYFMPVRVTYPVSTVAENGAPVSKLHEMYLGHPVISINASKVMVNTTLVRRPGTVKELICSSDYTINVRGFMIGANNEFPEAEVTALRNLWELRTTVGIQCPLTDIFLLRTERNGSDQVVVKELRLPEVVGIKHVKPYELVLESDMPFSLTMTKKAK